MDHFLRGHKFTHSYLKVAEQLSFRINLLYFNKPQEMLMVIY